MELKPFAQWPLEPALQERLAHLNFIQPTPVQAACWEGVSEGGDLLVQSCTGTGKTLAFALPLLNNPACSEPGSVLVLLPTRELAMQVARVVSSLGGKVALLYGGGSYSEQLRSLRQEPAWIVATPGRLLDHLERGSVHLERVRALVLDEADEILDLGFAEELDRILAVLPAQRQSLLFSATLPAQMEELAAKTLRPESQRLSLSVGLSAAQEISHLAYVVPKTWRPQALANLLWVEEPTRALIFCHTKAECEELGQSLIEAHLPALTLHGDMAQAERTRTLNLFRCGQARFLVATDVAARGIDVPELSHVINMALPRQIETYIHRVGRTGRAGRQGKALIFLAPHEVQRAQRLWKEAHLKPKFATLPQAEEVRRRLRADFHRQVGERLGAGVEDDFRLLASEFLSYLSPLEALSALLSLSPAARALFQAGFEIPLTALHKAPARAQKRARELAKELSKGLSAAAKKAGIAAGQGWALVQVSIGRKEGLDLTGCLRLMNQLGGLKAEELGNIEIRSHHTLVEVPRAGAKSLTEALANHPWGPRQLQARLVPAPQFKPDRARSRKGSPGQRAKKSPKGAATGSKARGKAPQDKRAPRGRR